MSLATLAKRGVAPMRLDPQYQSDGTEGSNTPPVDDDRFDMLTKYIPTETVTLYIAAMAIKDQLASLRLGITPISIYVAGAVLTPLILFLIAYGKARASGGIFSAISLAWPASAAVIAYLVWALAIPGLIDNPAIMVVAGFGAVLVSTFLALFEPVFGPR
jgi:hypothetical protein